MRNLLAALAVAAMSLSSASGIARAADANADSVLAAAAAALGAQNLKNLPSYKAIEGGTAAGLHATAVGYTDVAHGGAFADYISLGFFTQDQGYDGSAAWQRDAGGVVWVDGSQQGHASGLNEAFRESYALFTPSHGGANVELLPPQSDAGQTYDAVRVTAPGSVVPFDMWFDRTTHLPERFVETSAAVTSTTVLSDYRPVAGVRLPFAMKQTTSQGNEVDLQISRVDVAPSDISSKVRLPKTDVHDYAIEGGARATTIPIKLVDNHVYIDVMLDGKGPYKFIFDSGGSNVVDPAVLKEIGSSAKGSVQGSGVGASTEEASFAKVDSLGVGKAVLKDQIFAVLPVRAGFGVAGSAPVDGIIGAEVFARFVTVFDYAGKSVTLELPGTKAAGTPVAFVYDGTQPMIPCRIDDIAGECSIDTGSRASIDLFSPFVADHPSVVPANATQPGLNGFGIGGGDLGRLGRLPSLEMGGFDLKNLVAGFSSATAGAFAVPGIAANIGGAVLKRFTVTFDYPDQTMFLQPNASFAAVDEQERSGMFVINQGKIVVASVRPGTPAAKAGLVKGDTIVTLDGVPAAQLTLGSVREAFRAPAGTKVKLEVLDKGASAPRALTLTLEDYV